MIFCLVLRIYRARTCPRVASIPRGLLLHRLFPRFVPRQIGARLLRQPNVPSGTSGFLTPDIRDKRARPRQSRRDFPTAGMGPRPVGLRPSAFNQGADGPATGRPIRRPRYLNALGTADHLALVCLGRFCPHPSRRCGALGGWQGAGLGLSSSNETHPPHPVSPRPHPAKPPRKRISGVFGRSPKQKDLQRSS